METKVVVSPSFGKVASVTKAVEIVNREQRSFRLEVLLEDWVDESAGDKGSLDPGQVAKSPKGKSAKPQRSGQKRPMKVG